MIRVLIDANVLISFLLSNRSELLVSRAVMTALGDQAHLIVPNELLEEIRTVCQQKPYLRARISTDRLDQLLETVAAVGHLPASPLPRLLPSGRDPKDDYLLAYALMEKADYLLTGDEDLLVIGRLQGVQIVSPATFLQKMNP